MSRWTRRDLLRATAASAAVAVPAAGLGGSSAFASRSPGDTADDEPEAFDAAEVTAAGPLMVCVHDADGGDVSILHGTEEIVVSDRRLVAKNRPRQVRRQEGLKELAMSSHREAPEISKDPVADSTDTYAFVSTNPGEAGTVTLITNYIPSRTRPAVRTSTSSATTCCTGSTSTTTATAGPT